MAIRFTIKPGGSVKIEPMGYPGQTCHQATRSYEDRLEGKKTTEEVSDNATHSVVQKKKIQTKQ